VHGGHRDAGDQRPPGHHDRDVDGQQHTADAERGEEVQRRIVAHRYPGGPGRDAGLTQQRAEPDEGVGRRNDSEPRVIAGEQNGEAQDERADHSDRAAELRRTYRT
jgi:hypothetical protein